MNIQSITFVERPKAFQVAAKPAGPQCNLACSYCFYLEKERLYPNGETLRMSDEVLEAYVRQYIADQAAEQITFTWQGGEPTLMGLDFFRKAIAFQQQYANGKKIYNTLQTNGVLLDDTWAAFLAEQKFLVGVSIDGPRELHDAYRKDQQQQPSFDAVMRGIECLKKHEATWSTITVVNRLNAQQPLQVYRFLKEIGSQFHQYIPLVERLPDAEEKAAGLTLAGPPPRGADDLARVTEWSVRPEQYGEFLVEIFEAWVVRDVANTYVQLFDVALGNWMGAGASACIFAEHCGEALTVEHNGDVFSCDHYVYPAFKLGNLTQQSLGDMVASPAQQSFGRAKADTLPQYCRDCDVRFACHGECPKHRFIKTPTGEPGLNYLCAAYKRFFTHIEPYMAAMVNLIQNGRSPTAIMDLIAQHEQSEAWHNVGRNDTCPCGSGKKYKHCCQERREGMK